jgi:hypothetical protein
MHMYTYDEVKAEALNLARTLPRGLNPMTPDGCVYTNPNDEHHHCIAGQIGANFRLNIPRAGEYDNVGHGITSAYFGKSFDDDARDLLVKLQIAADGMGCMVLGTEVIGHKDADTDAFVPRPWGLAVALVAAQEGWL